MCLGGAGGRAIVVVGSMEYIWQQGVLGASRMGTRSMEAAACLMAAIGAPLGGVAVTQTLVPKKCKYWREIELFSLAKCCAGVPFA